MLNPLLAPLLRWLGKLSHPRLFLVIGALFLVDLAIPNFVPWDDLLLGLGTLMLANWKKRMAPEASGKPLIDGEAKRH
jgi:hypothetical protein